MLFNTGTFALFVVVVFGLYHALRHRGQNVLLLLASYVFYGFWDWRFCGLLVFSTVVDFTVARSLAKTDDAARRRHLLLASLVSNLGILGFFKYFGFFTQSAAAALEMVGLQANLPVLEIVLPVGISFYTFQTLGYTIDVYRRRIEPTADPIAFAVYVAYFPQLVAGPIERAARLLPQIERRRSVGPAELASGAQLFLIGLVRKVVVADGVAPIVNEVFASPESHTASHVLTGVFLFGLQIYGDFAGYSDMARGVSRWFGIELIENFQHPYFATNITDFWRRWHVSLSQWLRDYLYIPLGGNRGTTLATYRNLMLTMLLGGLWHGAAWTFVVWGGIHGVALAVHKAWGGRTGRTSADLARGAEHRLMRVAGWAGTMCAVWLAWVFFRARSFDVAFDVCRTVVEWQGPVVAGDLYTVVLFTAILLSIDIPQSIARDHCAIARWPLLLRGIAYFGWTLLVVIMWTSDASPFIYFQF